MAISSYKVFLMGLSGTTWSKLLDIKDFPDILGEPEMLETTTLSNKSHTYIPGIQDSEAMSFTCNYTKTDFDALYALAGNIYGLAVWFGATESEGVLTPTGSDGKFAFGGYVNVHVNGTGVNEVVDMTVTVTPTTDIFTNGTIVWPTGMTHTDIPA